MYRKILATITFFIPLLLSYNLWLGGYFEFTLDSLSQKELTYQLFYTTQSGDNFEERNSIKVLLSEGENRLLVKIPKLKIKKIKIGIGSDPGDIKISNIELEGLRKYSLKMDLFDFDQVDSFIAKDKVLYLTSKQENPSIVYKNKLNCYGKLRIDWLNFSLCVTFFLLFSIFTTKFLYNKTTKFLYNKNLSVSEKINRIFSVLFFCCLFVPMLNISQEEKSQQENRLLAKKPNISQIWDSSKVRFGEQWESWINDRFWKRKQLLKINNYVTSFASVVRNTYGFWFKSADLMFLATELGPLDLSTEKKDAAVNGIKSLGKFCKDNQISCYLEIVPRKYDFLSEEIVWRDSTPGDLMKNFPIEMKEITNLKIVYPYQEMLGGNTEDSVYFKTDHHWTQWGAFIGYNAFMKSLKNKFKIRTLNWDGFEVVYDKKVKAECDRKYWEGYMCQLFGLNINKCPLNTKYKYYKIDEKSWCGDEIYFYNENAKNNQKVVVIGNSFMENFITFLNKDFKFVTRYRSNTDREDNLNLSRWKEKIKNYRPDILIIIINSEYAYTHLEDLRN